MNFSEQELFTLHGLKENPNEAAHLHQAGILFWKKLEDQVLSCIREKKNLDEFLTREYDFVNFGISPEVLEQAQSPIDRMRASLKPGRYLKMMQVSDWILEMYSKIISGDRREALQNEIKIAHLQIQRFEEGIKNAQQLRKDILFKKLGEKIPVEKCAKPIDLLEHADNLRRRHLKIKKLSSKGVFIPVADKRKNFELEKEFSANIEQVGHFLLSVDSTESMTAIKRSAGQIEELINKIFDTEDAIVRLTDEMTAVAKKQLTVSPAEIEAALRTELDYVKDLTRLSAKRLHRESCCFMKTGDPCFTMKEIDDCIDRIMEFDPEIVHNQRVALFGLPSVLIVPGYGSALYDWKNNRIIVPLTAPGGNFMASIASGMIEYRMDVDEDKGLLLSYNKLPRHKDVKSVFHLKGELTKDYISWMTSEYKGYKTLPKEERKWFEQEVAPNKNEIAVPLEYRPFMLAGEAFIEKWKKTESLLAQGPEACPADVLWAASILLYLQGKFSQSMEMLLLLIRKDPDRPIAYYNLGHTCEKLMRKSEAIQFFGEYCKRNPQSWWAAAAMEHVRRLQTGHAA
jgi:tetratricopeptide (TPR) repeat protein